MAGKIRVLYVDDESALLEIGKVFLELSGDFTVTKATSAPDAIRLLEQERFDVIVSDYQMPEMDGIEFLVLVRTKFGQIPFILFTGKGREEVVIQAINNGVDFYLQKGGNPEAQFAELSHKIKTAASRKQAEEALRKSEANYRHLIEHSDEAIVVAQDGMLRLVNYRAVELTGYSEQELLSMQFIEFIHPDDRALVVERYQMRLKGEGLPSRYAFRICPKEGSTSWVEISAVTIDWDGRPATLNFLTDITERKQAEEALRESTERFRNVIDAANEYVFEIDAHGVITFISDHVRNILGYDPQELMGKTPFDVMVSPEEVARVSAIFGDHIRHKRPFRRMDHTCLSKDGRERTLTVTGLPIFDAAGEIKGYQGMVEDITERKKAEEALHDSEELFREVFNNANDAIFLYEITPEGPGKYIHVNDLAIKSLGYTREEFLLMSPADINPKPLFFEKLVPFALSKMRKEGHATFESIHIRKDGSEYPVEISTHIFPFKGRNVALSIVRDITGRKRAEEALMESEEYPLQM